MNSELKAAINSLNEEALILESESQDLTEEFLAKTKALALRADALRNKATESILEYLNIITDVNWYDSHNGYFSFKMSVDKYRFGASYYPKDDKFSIEKIEIFDTRTLNADIKFMGPLSEEEFLKEWKLMLKLEKLKAFT